MKLPASGGANFEPLAQGVYGAVCHMIVDLGIQAPYNPAYKPAHKILLGFQIPSERRDDGDPQVLTMIQTASLNKKANLRKIIENWFGKSFPSDEAAEDFEVRNLLGKGCFLNVTHTDKGEKVYANIASIVPLPKGVEKPELEGEPLYYSEFGDLSPQERSDAYGKLPEWVQKKVDGQLRAEPATAAQASSSSAGVDEDIPF